jgi:tetratricopeptide (TPR) repeat protein
MLVSLIEFGDAEAQEQGSTNATSTLLEKGAALKSSGQHEEAIKYYDRVLALDPNYVVLITCKKRGDINYLTSEALDNLTDFGYKCRNCNTVNGITLEDGELKKLE